MNNIMKENTYKLLKAFAENANRNILHPYDEKRLLNFVEDIIRENASIDWEDVADILEGDFKWAEEQVENLEARFHSYYDTLTVYFMEEI